MQVTIIGKGVFGQAIGSLLLENKVKFSYVDIDLPMTEKADIVFLSVPTQFLSRALRTNQQYFKKNTIFINCSKGIEENVLRLPFQIFKDTIKSVSYYCLLGPSFAKEIMEKIPTLVSLGYKDKKHLLVIKKIVQTKYFRIKECSGFEALELAAALKNVYAVICGFSDGLGYKMNTRAQLITIALLEFDKLCKAMGFKFTSLGEPAIVGDMILTCSSTESRNYRFGHNLARMTPKKAYAEIASTIEGYHTSQSIQKIIKKYNVSLPLASLTQKIINNGDKSIPEFNRFLARN